MVAPKTVLELKGIKKTFGKRDILQGISLKVEKKDIFGIIGPSGCGKSTLFRVIMGYYAPDEGSVLFQGNDLANRIKELRQKVGYTTQDDSFYPQLTVGENMYYYAHLYKVKRKDLKEHIEKILKGVELLSSKDLLVSRMSGGMRRRLNFAISLVHDPELLILDEPTTGLDPHLVQEFWKIVEATRSSGKTVIVTSHNFGELEEHCNKVAILAKGKVATITPARDLLKKFTSYT